MNNQNCIEKALQCEYHVTEIPSIARKFRDEGMTQLEMYFLFEEFFIQCDSNDARYDSLADTLDAIAGEPWAKGNGLYATELTNEEIEKRRKA